MSNLLVSIVLPTYNGEKYLAKSIESCLNQTYKNIELIIIDDCSSDPTSQIITGYAEKDERIKWHRNNVNRKLPYSLNKGFEIAKGSFFTWTSDDNMYLPEAINEMCSYLMNNPQVDIVYTNFKRVDENNVIKDVMYLPSSGFLYKENCIGACFLYKRIVHEKLNGYDETLFLAEDYDFWVRATKYFNYHHISASPYLYKLHSGSLTETKKEELMKVKYTTLIKNMDVFSFIPRRDRAEFYSNLALWFYRNGDNKRSRNLLLKTFFISPIFFIQFIMKAKRMFLDLIYSRLPGIF